MSHNVFSVATTLEFNDMTPSSVLLSTSSLYANCLTGESCSFPLSWMCGLIRSITKLCRAIEGCDDGLIAIAVFDIRKDQVSCHATIRLRASALAIRLLTIFLRDFQNWNSAACYPKEIVGKTTSYSGIARIPHTTSKNVCAAILPTILKLAGVKAGALETRFWWTRVDHVEKLIFMSTLARIREDRSSGHNEDYRVTHSDAELVKFWRPPIYVQSTSINDCKLDTAKGTMPDRSSHSSSSRSSPYSTRSSSPVSPSTTRQSAPLSDHLKLRTCNFPPRKEVVINDSVVAKWDGRVPCLSGVVFGPFTDGGFRHQAPSTPRGLTVNSATKGGLSIW